MENPKKRNWKVLTSEYLARKPWFTVRHESIELPDGRRIPDYYVFEYPDWVNVIAITKEGKFVFIDQYRHGLGEKHLDATEDIRVHLFSGAEVRDLLESGRIRQALMAAPLWRYAAEYGL